MLNKKDYLYLDENQEYFSNIGFGCIIEKIGEQQTIAYIDVQDTAKKLINFLENLSLSSSFTTNFKNFHLDIFIPREKAIQKTILPNVEYSNITKSIFLNQINDYDVIIVDNYISQKDSLISLEDILNIKNVKTKLIVLTPSSDEFKRIKGNFSNRVVCSYKKQKNLFTRSGLVNITGKPKGKTLFSLGYLLRKYLYKSDVKLIYFDKGSDIFGDAKFFDALKKWNQENTFYGTFDFVKTGLDINDENSKKNIELNKKEARDALMLFETALKKQAPVVGDEINTVLKKKYVDVSEVVDILKKTKNEVILTGETSKVELNKITELRVILKKSI